MVQVQVSGFRPEGVDLGSIRYPLGPNECTRGLF